MLFLRFSLGLIPAVICHLVKPRPFCGRDYLWVTDQRNREAADRKIWENLGRPEGLEPPTYRFEVVPGNHSQGLGRKRYPIFLDFTTFLFSLVSVLPVHSGHELVTNNSPVNQPAYRFTILRSLNSYGVAATCRDLIPAYDHSMWGLYGSLTNASTVRWHQKALRSWTHSHSIHHKGHRTLRGEGAYPAPGVRPSLRGGGETMLPSSTRVHWLGLAAHLSPLRSKLIKCQF